MGPLPDPAKSVPAAYVEVPAPAPEPPAAAPPEPVKPARRQMHGSFMPGSPGFAGFAMNSRPALDGSDLQRIVAERDAEARRAAAAAAARAAAEASTDTAPPTKQAAVAAPAPRVVRPLFMHDGADLVAPTGTPVYAAADGVVIGAAPNGGYGNWIRLDHQGKLSTVYGHLSSFAPGIQEGVQVSQGELIGFVGNTGRSTGAHLHFEILSDGQGGRSAGLPRAQTRATAWRRSRALSQAGQERARRTRAREGGHAGIWRLLTAARGRARIFSRHSAHDPCANRRARARDLALASSAPIGLISRSHPFIT